MLVHGTNQTGSSYAQQTSLWGRQPAADHSRARHLLALGIYGIVQVNRLGLAVDVILRENYRSVLAMQRGKEAPEHQDTGALYALPGETESSTELRAEYSPVVETAIDTELGNIALPDEQARAACLDSLYTIYQTVLYRVLDASGPAPCGKAAASTGCSGHVYRRSNRSGEMHCMVRKLSISG